MKEKTEKKTGKNTVKNVSIIALLLALGLGFGFGKGMGSGDGEGEKDKVEDTQKDNMVEAVNDITPTESPTATPAPKQFSVVVDKTDILLNNEKFSNAQSMVDMIQKELEADEGVIVILHDENAVANTLEDVINALDKNGILWVTPTPAPASKE